MPTYLYECPHCGEFEYEHSISENLEYCPQCIKAKDGEEYLAGEKPKLPKVKRLIAGGTNFILVGGGWAKDSYH